jgi:hypothetical protein
MCSSKSNIIRPRLKNGPITGCQPFCEKSLFLLEKIVWVASGPNATIEGRIGESAKITGP